MRYLIILILIVYSLQTVAYTRQEYQEDIGRINRTKNIVPHGHVCIVEIYGRNRIVGCYKFINDVIKINGIYRATRSIYVMILRDDITLVFFRNSIYPRIIDDRRQITDFIIRQKRLI